MQKYSQKHLAVVSLFFANKVFLSNITSQTHVVVCLSFEYVYVAYVYPHMNVALVSTHFEWVLISMYAYVYRYTYTRAGYLTLIKFMKYGVLQFVFYE